MEYLYSSATKTNISKPIKVSLNCLRIFVRAHWSSPDFRERHTIPALPDTENSQCSSLHKPEHLPTFQTDFYWKDTIKTVDGCVIQ